MCVATTDAKSEKLGIFPIILLLFFLLGSTYITKYFDRELNCICEQNIPFKMLFKEKF